MIDRIFNHLSIISIKNNYILYTSAILYDIYYMIWNILIIIKIKISSEKIIILFLNKNVYSIYIKVTKYFFTQKKKYN